MSPGRQPRLLVIDDEADLLPMLEDYARSFGFDVVSHTSARAALEALPDLHPDLVLVDLRMPELGGMDVLKAVRTADADCQVILMSGFASIDTAVEAVKAGALDYLAKPFDFERLKERLTEVLERLARREALFHTDAEVASRFEFHRMIGRSPVMQQLFDVIARVSPHARSVLITGETGTGKELVAQALHASGPRRTKRFHTVNCSAVVETLFESELFGHVRGAFIGATDNKVGLFEHADGGTLFLDEAGELPLPSQAKLLRAVEYGEIQRVGSLETRQVDVRVIAATNRDLRAASAAGLFRWDLYHRLSVIEINLPPLRERREDIPYLVAAFVQELSARLGRRIAGVAPAAEAILRQADWPGNVRELRNVIERACILAEGRLLSERDVQAAMLRTGSPVPTSSRLPTAAPHAEAHEPHEGSDLLMTVQKEQIQRVLGEVRGNKAEAAKRLGVSRRSLYRWLDRLHLRP